MHTKIAGGAALLVGTAVFASHLSMGRTKLESETGMSNYQDQEYAFEFDAINSRRAAENKSYRSFLNVKSMHCGIYHLAAGSRDGQSPHDEDEVYYVQSGKGKFHMDGREFDVQPGTILFVPAEKTHYFHDITEDLSLLVFFSKAEPGD